MRPQAYPITVALFTSLVACGGGGGGAVSPAPLPTPATWTQAASFGGPLTRGAAWFVLQGATYVVSGADTSDRPHNQVWKFDGAANTWTRKKDFPGMGFMEGAGFAIGAKGYVTLGCDNAPSIPGFTGELWEYEPTSDAWTKKAPFGGQSRSGVAVTVVGQKAYVFAGGRYPVASNELWEFDPASNTWARKADCPGAGRFMGMAFTVGTKGYFGLGRGFEGTPEKDVFEYDPTTDKWTAKKAYPGAAPSYAIGVGIGSKGYVGMGIAMVNPFATARDVWEFDPAANTWTALPQFGGEGRAMAIGFAIGTDLYFGMGSGTSNQNLGDLWRLKTAN